MPHASRPRRGRRGRFGPVVTVLAGVAAVVGVLVVPAASHGHAGAGGRGRSTPQRAASVPTPAAPSVGGAATPTTSTTSTAPHRPARGAIGAYPVGRTALDAVNSSLGGEGDRALPTTIWYPSVAAGRQARPARRGGPYPLLVFSQGYDIAVARYRSLLRAWASAGYVVAAPTYPHTDPSDPAALDENDILNHPGDLSAVITAVLAADGRAGPLSGLVRTGAIGAVGQSDGGDVTLAAVDNTCCRDGRIRAAAILSGAELASFPGSYFSGPQVPLLVAQGSADHVMNPVPCSVQLYDAASAPKYYLDLLGAGHDGPYVEHTRARAVVAAVTVDFFDAELSHQGPARRAMQRRGNVAGVAALADGPTTPAAPGTCPGAPSS